MAKKRSMAHLKKYQFRKKKAKARRSHVAKRKKRAKRPSRIRRVGRAVARRFRRQRGGGRGGYALKPSGEDLKLWAANAAIGFIETKAKSDGDFFVNKIPKPVAAIGYTGNLALALWVGSHFFRNKWLRLGARAAAGITAYHLGRMGKAFDSGNAFFTVAGWSDDEVASMLQQQDMGALNPTGESMPGTMAYDDADVVY